MKKRLIVGLIIVIVLVAQVGTCFALNPREPGRLGNYDVCGESIAYYSSGTGKTTYAGTGSVSVQVTYTQTHLYATKMEEKTGGNSSSGSNKSVQLSISADSGYKTYRVDSKHEVRSSQNWQAYTRQFY